MNMEELVEQVLFDKKLKKRKKIEEKVEKSSDEEEDLKAKKNKEEKEQEKEEEEEKEEKDAEAEDNVVIKVTLEISGTDQGEQEIKESEYTTFTNMSSILSLYDINTKNVMDPNKTTESLTLNVEEQISRSSKNTITFAMRLNVDETISINVLVNEMGQTFNNMQQAIQYFDQQFQNNILNILNKELR